MICPNCQTFCEDTDRFCYLCGAPLRIQPPQPKNGSRWVPILILIIMSAVGIASFFLTPGSAASHSAEEPWFQIQNGVLYFDETLYTGGSELVIPSEVNGQTVWDISSGCFKNCTELTSIVLPETLSSIGDLAFMGCTNLRGISIPESVVHIGSSVFLDCTSLEAVSIPGSVNRIGPRAFTGCEALSYIFYDGAHDQWMSLYEDFISPDTHVFCADGSFFQGEYPYQ